MCVLIFSTTFVWNISHLRRTERDMIKEMNIGLHLKYPYFCEIEMKMKFSRHIFEEYSNIKFHESPSSASGAVSCLQTDGRKEMT